MPLDPSIQKDNMKEYTSLQPIYNKKCYYGEPICEDNDIWQCESCKEQYCQKHSHYTELGTNIECVACERERKTNAS
jgi:hypothetical protein